MDQRVCSELQIIRRMTSENIFIEHEKWNRYSHPAAHLEQLRRVNDSAAIKLYFTQRNLSGCLVKQLSEAQIQKADGLIKCSKIKAIYKEKAKGLRKKSQLPFNHMLDVKFSSKTNVCDDQEQEVSQYLNIWEEAVLQA